MLTDGSFCLETKPVPLCYLLSSPPFADSSFINSFLYSLREMQFKLKD